MNKCIQVFCLSGLFVFYHLSVHAMGQGYKKADDSPLGAEMRRLNSEKNKFERLYNSLSNSAKRAISSHCDGGSEWYNNLMSLQERRRHHFRESDFDQYIKNLQRSSVQSG